jgi:hypothetical protein
MVFYGFIPQSPKTTLGGDSLSQWSKKAKQTKDKLLEHQNKIRKKYGLQPLKRVRPETILYLLNDNDTDITETKKYDEVMYQ